MTGHTIGKDIDFFISIRQFIAARNSATISTGIMAALRMKSLSITPKGEQDLYLTSKDEKKLNFIRATYTYSEPSVNRPTM